MYNFFAPNGHTNHCNTMIAHCFIVWCEVCVSYKINILYVWSEIWKILMKLKKEIGCRIRAIREANKLTQEKMADVLDIGSTSHYQNIENGRFFPSYKYYERLKEKFNVSADYILFG